jgi:hypothetical protein
MSSGFEIETEFTIHALELRMGMDEVKTHYAERAEGSSSKLRTFHDGFRILSTIVTIISQERPIWFFGAISLAVLLLSLGMALPVLETFLDTGLVPRFPTAILSMVLLVISLLSLVCGLIIRMVTVGRQEAKRLCYLAVPSPRSSLGLGETVE